MKRKSDNELEAKRLRAIYLEGLTAHDLQLWKQGGLTKGAEKVHRVLAERGLL